MRFGCHCHSVLELNALNEFGDQLGTPQLQPAALGTVASLKTIARMLARETQPRVLAVRSRTLAHVDSIGLGVRR